MFKLAAVAGGASSGVERDWGNATTEEPQLGWGPSIPLAEEVVQPL
jgi:hypothetical protein